MTLLIGLRQGALWEVPAAKLAAERGGSAQVRAAGEKISAGEAGLDQQVGVVVGELGVTIPAAAGAEQQGVLERLQGAQGGEFDQLFVRSLRDAYGSFYTVIGEVRASTRVAAVRALADRANVAVMGWMQALESTGLVAYQSLAPAAIPPAQDLSTMGMAQADAGISAPVPMVVLWMLAVGAAGVGAVAFLWISRKRRAVAEGWRR